MAEVVRPGRLPGGELAPLTATSRGVGEVVAAALDARLPPRSCSASAAVPRTDGGAGMVQALGARRARRGRQRARRRRRGARRGGPAGPLRAAPRPGRREHGRSPATSTTRSPVRTARPRSTARRRAPTAGRGRLLDGGPDGLGRRRRRRDRRATCATTPGAGAAGGVGFAAVAVLGAQLRPGAALVPELTGLGEALAGADLVITGEGSLDEQTLSGKAPAGVVAEAAPRGRAGGRRRGPVPAGRQSRWPVPGSAPAYALVDEATVAGVASTNPGRCWSGSGRIARPELDR